MSNSQKINALLNNIAKKAGIEQKKLLRRYFLDQFLLRLAYSEYKDKFILKGGMLISAKLENIYRTTMDMDVTAVGIKVNEENIRKIFNQIAQIDMNDALSYQLKKIISTRKNAAYGGYEVFLDVCMDKTHDVISIDVTTGDVITPKPVLEKYRTLLNKEELDIYTYNFETILAEKFESILANGTWNTRMKDYFDCSEIINTISINIKLFRRAFGATAIARKSYKTICDWEDVFDEIEKDKNLKKQWKNYQNKNIGVDYTYEEVLDAIYKIAQIAFEN